MTTHPGSASACRRAARFGIADHCLLARCPLAHKIAHHHSAGRNTHARPQLRVWIGLEPRYRLGQREPRAHRPLGIVLMRLRPAEIGQDAVAQELGNVPLEPADDIRACHLIAPHDVAQVLGVEARGELG